MDDVRMRIISTLALAGLLAALGGCAYGAHLEHAQAEGPGQGEPQPIPAQHAAAGQADPQAEPRFEPMDPDPELAAEPEPADQFAYADQGGPVGQGAQAGQGAKTGQQSGAAQGPTNSAPGQTYTVREGDTLWSIAESAYGDGQKWRDIRDANPGLNPDDLHEGQQLTLP